MFKKTLSLLTIILFILILGANHSNVQAQVTQRTIRVAIYENSPKIYTDSAGTVTGLYGDLLHYIADQENWQLVFVPGTFPEGLERLENGEVDIMVDTAYSDERAEIYDLTHETVLSSWGVIYTQKNSNINSFSDLNNKSIAVLNSSIYVEGDTGFNRYVNAFDLNIDIIEVGEYDEVFNLIDSNQVEAGIVSRISGLEAEGKFDNIKKTDLVFNPTELRFALTKNDTDNQYLIDRLDYWVNHLRSIDDGFYDQTLRKHNLFELSSPDTVIPSWVIPATVFSLAIITISWVLILLFRQARKTALNQLQQKDFYFNSVVSSAPIIFGAIRNDGIITFADGKALTKITDNPNSLVGQSAFELYKDYPVIVRNLELALKGEERNYSVEINGYNFDVIATPLIKNKKTSEVLTLSIDTTEHHQLEKAKDEFIKLVQHQLRTAPGAMKWALQLLSPKVYDQLDTEEKQIWSTLEYQTNRMTNLANLLSMITQIAANNLPVESKTIDLKNYLDEVIGDFSDRIKEKELIVTHNLKQKLEINHDKKLIKVILNSLVSNAVTYSHNKSTISIKVKPNNGTFVIAVKDEGIGMSQDLQKKIFTRLFRGDEAVKMNPDGLGISLYISKALVKFLQGKIWFESTPKEGTTFFIELPKKFQEKNK